MTYQHIGNNPLPILQRQYVHKNSQRLLVRGENDALEEDTMHPEYDATKNEFLMK